MRDEQKTIFLGSSLIPHPSSLLKRNCTMAEPHEALPAVGALTSRFPDAPTPRLGDAPDPGYRSLSVLALLGFGISALYAAICLLLGLIALISRNPMPALGYSLWIAVGGFLVCLVARFRIARSEGTLAGRMLTGWGLVLSL